MKNKKRALKNAKPRTGYPWDWEDWKKLKELEEESK